MRTSSLRSTVYVFRYGIDATLWLYVPDLEKFKTWTPPMAEMVK